MQATASQQMKGRLPKQIRRALPVYVTCILIFLVIANLDSFGSSIEATTNAFRRDVAYESRNKVGTLFPKKIWQTWKVNPLDFALADLTTARTWTSKNPGHRYEVLTDNNDLLYVETAFGRDGLNRPDIVETYKSLTLKIIKADLLRYLVMFADGGVYADIDVEALKPIRKFIPERWDEEDVDMIVGVEIDQPAFRDHPILGKKSESFCQWTFACKPGLPVMMRIIEYVMAYLHNAAKEQKVSISEIKLDFDEVISGTGPSAFTNAILAEMSERTGQAVTWQTFHDIDESKLVGGVLVLTVQAFAAGQGHSDSGNHFARTALVKHHYHASGWPTTHPRYSHPIYGTVEKCNWVPACVKLWDANTFAFNALSSEEQARRIAIKESKDAAEAEAEEQKTQGKQAPAALPAPAAQLVQPLNVQR